MATDTASALYEWFKESDDAEDIRDLIFGGADSIIEAGDLEVELLQKNLVARRTAGETTKILAISIQDAGDLRQPQMYHEFAVIRLFDLHNGYRCIRPVRDLIRLKLQVLNEKGITIDDVNGERRGILTLEYQERTGFLYSRDYGSNYEALTYLGSLIRDSY